MFFSILDDIRFAALKWKKFFQWMNNTIATIIRFVLLEASTKQGDSNKKLF